MKVTDKFIPHKTGLSFEIFPPKHGSALTDIDETLGILSELNPDFISVTFGAGGSSNNNKTIELAKKIKYEYTEIDGCGSLDFLFRGLKFHVWEYEDRVWGAETNIYEAGRSQDIEGNYEEVIAREILSWPDMMPGS